MRYMMYAYAHDVHKRMRYACVYAYAGMRIRAQRVHTCAIRMRRVYAGSG